MRGDSGMSVGGSLRNHINIRKQPFLEPFHSWSPHIKLARGARNHKGSVAAFDSQCVLTTVLQPVPFKVEDSDPLFVGYAIEVGDGSFERCEHMEALALNHSFGSARKCESNVILS